MSELKNTALSLGKKFLLYVLPYSLVILAAIFGVTKPELLAKVNTALAPAGISIIATTDTIGSITPQMEGGDVVPPEGGVTMTTASKDLPNVTVKVDTPIENIEPAAQ